MPNLKEDVADIANLISIGCVLTGVFILYTAPDSACSITDLLLSIAISSAAILAGLLVALAANCIIYVISKFEEPQTSTSVQQTSIVPSSSKTDLGLLCDSIR